MKLGIISDIHSNVYGLRAVLEQLQDADMIICAGDITGYYPFVNEVFDELKKIKNLEVILGNHDAYLLGKLPVEKDVLVQHSVIYMAKYITKENFEYLKSIDVAHKELEVDGLKIKVWHGGPQDEFEERIYPDSNFRQFENIDADVIILGHSHWPLIKVMGNKVLINPGSCGQPRDYIPKAAFATFDTQTKEAQLHRVDYDMEAVIKKVSEEKMDKALIEILQRTK